MTQTLNTLLSGEGIELNGRIIDQLAAYETLLCEWNEKMDLTNTPREEIPLKHFADSLKPLITCPTLFPSGASAIDVGSGAGFPGLPIAIARPDISVTLLDAQQKRCDFLEAVVSALELSNVRVIHGRAEDQGKADLRQQFDLALARAVAPLPVLMEYLLPFVRVNGFALAWKGPSAAEEMPAGTLAADILGGGVPRILEIPLHGLSHVLVAVEKIAQTPARYPRKNGIPGKKPLGSSD